MVWGKVVHEVPEAVGADIEYAVGDMSNPENNDLPKLGFSREETAKILGVSVVSIDRLARRRLLRPCRATRRPVFPRWEIERFLRETQVVA